MSRSTNRRMSAVARSKYWRQEDAETALDALADSGQSIADFARQWGISDARLRRWQGQLGRESTKSLIPAFHPVEVVRDDRQLARPESGVEIALRSGHRVILHRGFDARVLEELLRVLGAEPC